MTYRWAEEWFWAVLEKIEEMEGAPLSVENPRRLEEMEKSLLPVEALFAPESQYEKQLENVRAAMEHPAGEPETELLPFLAELKEEIYFRGCVQPWQERWADYYREEFAPHHANRRPERRGEPPVTVFVPACGHLEATRACVESILRHTPPHLYELLLIDHGSRDGTRAYIQSIAEARVMSMKENVRMLMFSAAFRACRGKYMAFVSNDTQVEEGWLEGLLACLQSTPAAVSATPITPHTSNFQSLGREDAEKGDVSVFWRQRSRIMPVIALYDLEKVNEIGFADRLFWSMEFWDDDFSLRARRRGFWQMLCTDISCAHLGSLTGRAAWEKERTLERGRELFREKHGIDPWAKGFCRQEDMMVLVRQLRPAWKLAEGLAIDCGFGDAPMEAGNCWKRMGTEVRWLGITTETDFLPDLAAYAAEGQYVEALEPWLAECFDCAKYQIILREAETAGELLELLGRGLTADGILLTMGGEKVCAGLEKTAQAGRWQVWRKKREG